MAKKIRVSVLIVALCLAFGVQASASSLPGVELWGSLPELQPWVKLHQSMWAPDTETPIYSFPDLELQFQMDIPHKILWSHGNSNTIEIRLVSKTHTTDNFPRWQTLLQPDDKIVLRITITRAPGGHTQTLDWFLFYDELLAILEGEPLVLIDAFTDDGDFSRIINLHYTVEAAVIFEWANGLGVIRSNVMTDRVPFQGRQCLHCLFYAQLAEYEAWLARQQWLEWQEAAGVTR